MIRESRRILVNEPGHPVLTRDDIWAGLVMKADNALPFVPGMTKCEVVERASSTSFVRAIEFRGDSCRERVTLTTGSQVKFERLDGNVMGTILNDIDEGEDGLGLRFSFALSLVGEEEGSPAEVEYGELIRAEYLKAVDATLAAIRRLKVERDDLIKTYYDIVDSMDLKAFKAIHTEDATVTFANFPTATGPDQIAGAIGDFWSSIKGLSHTIVNRWDHADETVLEVAVDYTRHDGKHVILPCVSILRPAGSKVADLRIFIDVAPIYAES